MSKASAVRVRPTPLAFLAVGWLLLIDLANQVSAGAVSLAALLSLGSVTVMAFVLLGISLGLYEDSAFTRSVRRPLPLALSLFALWAVLLLPLHPTSEGVQNVTVYLGFVFAIAVTGRLSTPESTERLLGHVQRIGWLVALVYLATVAGSGLQASSVYSARAVALSALVLLAVAVARRRSRLLPFLLLFVVLASLSRTATLLAILVFALGLAVRSPTRGRAIRVFVLIGVGAGAAWLAFTKFAPLRDRFQGGDQALSYGNEKFNVSGRSELWSYTLQSSRHHLWFGDGPGSADAAILRRFVTVSHPHNDYLRLLHDFGIVGLALFVIGYVTLMRRTWVLGRTTGQPVHWAAFLAMLGVAGAAITDNVIVYPFVMIPLGVLVGASVSVDVPARETKAEYAGSAAPMLSAPQLR